MTPLGSLLRTANLKCEAPFFYILPHAAQQNLQSRWLNMCLLNTKVSTRDAFVVIIQDSLPRFHG